MEISDRLSSLPDDVLCHILSFLPTKFSVATSILATRYRFLWADVPNLDFDCDIHYGESSFVETISRVMSLRNARDINTFRLRLLGDILFDEAEADAQLDTWIRTTIAHNVQSLDIDLDYQIELPPCLLTCKTLVNLSLHFCDREGMPDAIFLPNLKRLHLDCCQYGGDEKLQGLISGCPVLEELDIELISVYDLECCVISSPTIKWLKLNLDMYQGCDSEFWDYKLQINTPSLRYLNVRDVISQHISTRTFNSLVEADICLYNDLVNDDVLYSSSVLELVEKVCQVKCLTLSINYGQFLDSSFAVVTSKFINLTKLELAADWRFLFKFLENADNLQVLIIREVHDKFGRDNLDRDNLKCWREPQQVPTCISSHLRQVTIDAFGYSEDEFTLVSYILKNGEVLKMMKLHGRCYVPYLKDNEFQKKKFNAFQRISEVERRSQTCKLKLS
ncbi:hypothetical protein BUALT_Bualt16G0120200 [Buddleja alternifolia]|uniref:FBD domain-containing protein n=1 Tax=Buddleja alternifolia TaxID=168488 RepID=A0AAV6WJ92_9LAMI|nr:hypothetical protein BUALT_Bualt16G0120200 [Buddleja alternifolia]